MSLANAFVAKVAVAATATAVLGVGGAAVVGRQGHGPSARPHVAADGHAVLPSDGGGPTTGEVVIDPGTGALRLVTGGDEARAGVGTGARTTSGGSDPGRQGPVGAQAPSVTAGGSAKAGSPVSGAGTITVPGVGGGAGATGGTVPPGNSGGSTGGGGNGTTGGSTPGDGGSGGGWSVTAPTAPNAPAVTTPGAPSSASAYSQGSFTLTVPGTGRVSKQLCLSGTVANKCQTVTVPAVQPVQLTVSYSGNAGVDAPTFTTAPCAGGASVGVAGLTPGATVTVVVEGKRLSATVPERGAHQTASLCDA